MEGALLILAACGIIGVWYLHEAVLILRKILEEFRPTNEGAIGIRSLLIDMRADIRLKQ